MHMRSQLKSGQVSNNITRPLNWHNWTQETAEEVSSRRKRMKAGSGSRFNWIMMILRNAIKQRNKKTEKYVQQSIDYPRNKYTATTQLIIFSAVDVTKMDEIEKGVPRRNFSIYFPRWFPTSKRSSSCFIPTVEDVKRSKERREKKGNTVQPRYLILSAARE